MELKDGKVVIESPITLSKLQAPYELSIRTRSTWLAYSRILDKIVTFFGPDKEPTDILRTDTDAFLEWIQKKYNPGPSFLRMHASVGSAWFGWMQWNDLVPLDFNPFRPFARKENRYEYTGERKRGTRWVKPV